MAMVILELWIRIKLGLGYYVCWWSHQAGRHNDGKCRRCQARRDFLKYDGLLQVARECVDKNEVERGGEAANGFNGKYKRAAKLYRKVIPHAPTEKRKQWLIARAESCDEWVIELAKWGKLLGNSPKPP